MKLTYRIDPGSHMVRVEYRGHPTYHKWATTMRNIFADPEFIPGSGFLFDKRVANRSADQDYVRAVSDFYLEHKDRMGRCAIVVTGTFSYSMSCVTAVLCGPDESVRAFTDLTQAEDWLQRVLR